MISTNLSSNNNSNNITFSARKKELKIADEICRRVAKEFPTLSNTKIQNRIDYKNTVFKNYENYLSNFIYSLRYYSNLGRNKHDKLFKEMANVKHHKIGNCAEIADATYIALKLNGYKDVKLLNLFAYNKKTKMMRPIDHTTVGINFKVPKDYEFYNFDNPLCNKYVMAQDRYRYRIYPQNKSIIIDPWAGFTEYGKASALKFKNHKAIDAELGPNEELCYIPMKDDINFDKMDLDYLGNSYPTLVRNINKPQIGTKPSDEKYKVNIISEKIVDKLKTTHNLLNIKRENQANIKTI